jgi:predicted MPP superfamily phosphohydrolase
MNVMNLAWLTDIHLNFLRPEQLAAFVLLIERAKPDALLITGDIAEADTAAHYIAMLRDLLEVPLWFVLGNHDYYGSSIWRVRERMCDDLGDAYLPQCGVVKLSSSTVLIGVDGWADGRAGDFAGSSVVLNDYYHIEELGEARQRGKWPLLGALQRRGREEAEALLGLLAQARSYSRIIVAAHVPPFVEACWHEGSISNVDWLPHFTCVAVGDVLREFAVAHPETSVEVYCGHTHGVGVASILPNLVVHTGGAEYGRPAVQRIIVI